MELSLPTAVISAFIGSAVLLGALVYVSTAPGAPKGVQWWIVGIALNSIRYLVVYWIFATRQPSAIFIAEALQVVGAIILASGAMVFLGHRVSIKIVASICLITIAWAAYTTLVDANFLLRAIPLYLISGSAVMAVGISFLRARPKGQKSGFGLAGTLFTLWGLHKLDYPFLRPVEWFAPYGFLIAMVLFSGITISLIIIVQRRMFLLSEKEVRERRVAEAALQESELRFRRLFENSDVSIWNEDFSEVCDALEKFRLDGVVDLRHFLKDNSKEVRKLAAKIKVTQVNQATLKLFGAKSNSEFFQNIDRTFGPDSMAVFIDELCAIWERRKMFRSEASFKTLDGKSIDAIVSIQIPETKDGFSSIPVNIVDITWRKKLEEEVRQSRELFSRAFQSNPNLIALACPETGEHIDVNEAWLETLKFSREEVIGNTSFEIGQWADIGDREQILKEHSEQGRVRDFVSQFKAKDGTLIDCAISTEPIKMDHQNLILWSSTDITDRKRAEATLQQSEERFRTLYHQSPLGVCLEDYSRVKSRIDALINQGIEDFRQYFEENEDDLKAAISDIQLLDANDTLSKMSGASSFEEYKEYMQNNEIWNNPHWRKFYLGELQALASGKNTFSDEVRYTNMNGHVSELRCTTRIAKDHEDDWSEIITTIEDVTARKIAEDQLLIQATIDQVTGLPNRSLLFDRLHQAIEHARRDERNIALIFFDLDLFKQVNDTRGHAVGDQLLKQVAERLQRLIRHEDTVARLGGDEFIILLHDVEMPNGPEIVARKIVEAFTAPIEIEGNEIFITASMGISIFPDDGEEPEVLLQNADAAMYKSKHQGRNTFRFFTLGLQGQAEQHARIAERLRHALERDDFELHFQPIIDIENVSVFALEALIRWDDAILKVIPPEQLISVAEEAGFILPIDRWVLDEACRKVAAWRADVAPSLKLSVNVSRSHIRSPDLIKAVKQALNGSGLPAEVLTIEITENLLIEDSPKIIQRLNELTDLGVKLALDDFGTGYSSLGYLKKFNVNVLKIDRTFIKDILDNSNDLALVEAIIAMSRSLDLTLIAEGVETPEQLELLRASGCHLIQGFHFSEPLSASEMSEYLLKAVKEA